MNAAVIPQLAKQLTQHQPTEGVYEEPANDFGFIYSWFYQITQHGTPALAHHVHDGLSPDLGLETIVKLVRVTVKNSIGDVESELPLKIFSATEIADKQDLIAIDIDEKEARHVS